MWIALYDIITLQGVASNTERFVRFAHKELSQKKKQFWAPKVPSDSKGVVSFDIFVLRLQTLE